MNFLNPVDLELKHVRVIVQGMVRVANSDGAHERELVLIRQFYESCRADEQGIADFSDLLKAPLEVDVARDVLSTADLKATFMASCYLVAYADGELSKPEQDALAQLVRDLGIDAETAENVRELVKDQLLMKIARSSNLGALKKVAAKL
jgi:tellurite resistance protein